MRSIVSTAPGGGVLVTHPAPETMAFLTHGGAPDGYYGRSLDRDWEIHKFVQSGIREWIAARWIDALMTGGQTDAEAYELIRDKDTKDEWTAKELWDRDKLPDRWFRNAWHRSQNGGPISIDLKKAKGIQFSNIKAALDHENGRRALSFDEPLEIDLPFVRNHIQGVSDERELRSVWPLQAVDF